MQRETEVVQRYVARIAVRIPHDTVARTVVRIRYDSENRIEGCCEGRRQRCSGEGRCVSRGTEGPKQRWQSGGRVVAEWRRTRL